MTTIEANGDIYRQVKVGDQIVDKKGSLLTGQDRVTLNNKVAEATPSGEVKIKGIFNKFVSDTESELYLTRDEALALRDMLNKSL